LVDIPCFIWPESMKKDLNHSSHMMEYSQDLIHDIPENISASSK